MLIRPHRRPLKGPVNVDAQIPMAGMSAVDSSTDEARLLTLNAR